MPERADLGRRSHGEGPFFVTALVSLCLGCSWIAVRHDLLLGYFYSSELLAITHLITLGFVTSLIMGVLLRLGPMSLGVEPGSRRVARVQYLVFVIGASGMISHFWISEWVGMAWATLLVAVAACLQIYNLFPIYRSAWKGSWVARYASASMLYLVLAATLGALLGFNKALDWEKSLLGGRFLSNLFAHVHLAALGWVTTMILGFQLKLVPSTRGKERYLPVRFGLLQVGTVGLVGSFLAGVPWEAPFALMVLAAVSWQFWGPSRALASGRAREWEVVPLWILWLAVLAGLLLALGVPGQDSPLRMRLQFALGYAGLFGWMVLTILIVSFKLFPIWVWQERFQPLFGSSPVPGMKELYSRRLRLVSNLLVTAGVSGTVAGILGQSRVLLGVSTTLVLVGILCFLLNFIRLVRWAHGAGFRPRAEDWEKFRRMFPDRK